MTFSLLGRCPRTGQLGAAVTTSDLAVGARVLHARARLGVAVTQHRTDPRLGPRALDLLAGGCTPREAVDGVAASTPDRWWRQVAVLTADDAAVVSGAGVTPVVAAKHGEDCVAVGNMLVSEAVAPAMTTAFAGDPSAPLAGRLVAGLAAGEAAGGETGALRSAAVLVVETEAFALVDLRIDDAADPLGELARLWTAYAPWTRDFVDRALRPDAASGAPDHTSTTT